MAETANISKMAEKLSEEIFSIFGWERIGPMNINWSCSNPEHEKKTHPSDIVFKYKEAYTSKITYLNVDLKSYASGSIEPFKIENTLRQLSLTIDCANKSPGWKDNYLDSTNNYVVDGLLFIYNHDGDYDKNFNNVLDLVDSSKLNIPKGKKIHVLGPKDIVFLNSVIIDIKANREIPLDNLTYYYPDLTSKRANSSEKLAATIEMLQSPYISVKYSIENKRCLRMYCRDSGETLEEFLYLFDYLFHYQQLQECDEIIIKLYAPHKNASALFSNAKNIYAEARDNMSNIKVILEKVHYESMTQIITRFSEIEIGMEDTNE